jgi:16S rRNA (cytosine967-C5)-methyltransferase
MKSPRNPGAGGPGSRGPGAGRPGGFAKGPGAGTRPASGGEGRAGTRPASGGEGRAGTRPASGGEGRGPGSDRPRTGKPGGGFGGGKGGARRPDDRGGRPRARTPVGYDARKLAADLVAGVQKGKLLDYLLDEGPLAAAYQALESRDRALARAIVGVTLRRWGQVEDAVARYLERPLPDKSQSLKAIIGTAAAQILFMDLADHAAVALAVDLAAADRDGATYKGLVNAILRRVSQDKALILADQDAVTLNTPAWMLARWTETYGEETARAIAASHLVEPSLDLSVKSDPEGWAARLGGVVLPTGSVRVTTGGAVEKLEGYSEGQWWVQDAAATLPVHLLGDVKGKKVADLCAAPGGKTAMLAHLGADVTSVDVSWHRLQRLKRNLFRLDLKADVVVTDITEWLSGPFDMILLDAPCTATGTLRRHPDGALSKKPEDVQSLASLQRKLLDQAIRLVKPGGLIVYSTCSLEPEEGPDQIRRLMLIDAPVDRVPITADDVFGLADAVTPEGDLRTLPMMLPNVDPRMAGLDGFFAARLRKRV